MGYRCYSQLQGDASATHKPWKAASNDVIFHAEELETMKATIALDAKAPPRRRFRN
jgi:hypothetical protein